MAKPSWKWIAAVGLVMLGSARGKGEPVMTITLSSSAFAENQPIPRKYTADGDDVHHRCAWSQLPPGTRQLALVVDDPDAPRKEPWVHWLIYNIPPDVEALGEHVAHEEHLQNPDGAAQGRNSWTSGATIGYRGPAPPKGHGTHHYHFRLYALDKALHLAPGLDKDQLLQAIKGHVLGEGVLIGTYER